jgi:hypothetical protein
LVDLKVEQKVGLSVVEMAVQSADSLVGRLVVSLVDSMDVQKVVLMVVTKAVVTVVWKEDLWVGL